MSNEQLKSMHPKILILFILLVSFSSCFEIREEVNLKADGSGELTIVANLSESKGKVRQYLKTGHAEGHYVPSPHEVETMLSQVKSILNNTAGIEFSQTKEDWSNYIFTLTTRFENVGALNEAAQKLSKHFAQYGMPPVEVDNFSFVGEKFERHFDYPSEPKKFAELPPVQKKMLDAAKMISIYRFEKKITGFSHPSAQLSPSGRAIMLQLPLSDLAKGTGTMANKITF